MSLLPTSFLGRLITPLSIRIVHQNFGRGQFADWYVVCIFGIRIVAIQAWGLK